MPIIETGIVVAAGALVLDATQETLVDYGGSDVEQAFETNSMSNSRGTVLPLSAQQRVNRALYLAGELRIEGLDGYARKPNDGRTHCPVIYYRLSDYNGGKDPTAPDPATYWRKDATSQLNVTSDCIGGAAWCAGFDRYQPARFSHIYSGWINTDSMIMDAGRDARCFTRLALPKPGCFVVCATGSGPKKSIGHIGVVVSVPAGFALNSDWSDLGVVDVAARTGRANCRNSRGGAGWQERDGIFVESIMR